MRNSYTVLDVLSDTGGMQSIIGSAISIWIGIWNYNHFENFMASKLYKIGHKKKPGEKSKK